MGCYQQAILPQLQKFTSGNNMKKRHVILTFTTALGTILQVPSVEAQVEPDLSSLRGAVVIVLVKGIVPSLGNAPVASQGTGFFISKDGFLVTANHLHSDLGKVDETSVTYELHFG